MTNSTDEDIGHDEIIQHIRKSFAFLEERVVAKVSVKDGALDCLVTYVTELVSVEVSVEWFDQAVTVHIAQTVGKRPPPGWQIHEGRLVRVYLYQALQRGEERDRALLKELAKKPRRRGKRGKDGLMTKITEQAEIVRGMKDRFAYFHDQLFSA